MASLNDQIKLGAPTGDLDGLVLPNDRTVYYAPAWYGGVGVGNYSRDADGRYNLRETGGVTEMRGICWHSAEEDNDNIEVTPRYFQQPNAKASTNLYIDGDGDLYQMVDFADIAWAQGVPPARDKMKHSRPWMPKQSYNTFLVSIELEGRAKTLTGWRVGSPQYQAAVALAAFLHRSLGIPLELDRWVMHSEISTWKSDPGSHWLSTKAQLFADVQAALASGGGVDLAAAPQPAAVETQVASPLPAAPPTAPNEAGEIARLDEQMSALAVRVEALEGELANVREAWTG